MKHQYGLSAGKLNWNNMNDIVLIHKAEFDDFLVERTKKDRFLSKCVIVNDIDKITISYLNEDIVIQFTPTNVWIQEPKWGIFTGTHFDISIPYCKKSLVVPGTTLFDWCDHLIQEVYQLWSTSSPTITDFYFNSLKNKPR